MNDIIYVSKEDFSRMIEHINNMTNTPLISEVPIETITILLGHNKVIYKCLD